MPGKLTKDQIQKIILSAMGFVALIYVYFNFFLGPLNKGRAAAEASIADLQTKLASSKSDLAKARNLEERAAVATGRFAALKAMSPDGAPIAWFPPRLKVLFANHQIEKAVVRLERAKPSPNRKWQSGPVTTGSSTFLRPTSRFSAAPCGIREHRAAYRPHPDPYQSCRREPAIPAGRPQRHLNSPELMKKLVVPFLIFFSALPLGTAAEPALAPETKTDEAQATPAAPIPVLELKNKSSFAVEEHSRSPFWPIGWKPSTKFGRHNESVGPDILPASFIVTSITVDPGGRFAIINGRAMNEGQVFGLQMGNQTYQITVKAIQDGQVVLLRRDQEIIVPLRRR